MSQQQWGHGYWTGYRVAQRQRAHPAPKCDACGGTDTHAEGCPVARLAWHRRRREGALQVYCAGKISKGDWRHTLLGWELRNQCAEPARFARWPTMERAIFGRHHYVGPYFIGDDHGCFHGEGTHGAGVQYDMCPRCQELQDVSPLDEHAAVEAAGFHLGENWRARCRRCGERWSAEMDVGCVGAYDGPVRRDQVLERCRQAVARCDVVFAWLEDTTAYGTLVELGWADALGKTIWVASPSWWRDLWFAYTTAHDLRIGLDSGPVEALRQFIDTYVRPEDPDD
jgi:hypothetical protein